MGQLKNMEPALWTRVAPQTLPNSHMLDSAPTPASLELCCPQFLFCPVWVASHTQWLLNTAQVLDQLELLLHAA